MWQGDKRILSEDPDWLRWAIYLFLDEKPDPIDGAHLRARQGFAWQALLRCFKPARDAFPRYY